MQWLKSSANRSNPYSTSNCGVYQQIASPIQVIPQWIKWDWKLYSAYHVSSLSLGDQPPSSRIDIVLPQYSHFPLYLYYPHLIHGDAVFQTNQCMCNLTCIRHCFSTYVPLLILPLRSFKNLRNPIVLHLLIIMDVYILEIMIRCPACTVKFVFMTTLAYNIMAIGAHTSISVTITNLSQISKISRYMVIVF